MDFTVSIEELGPEIDMDSSSGTEYDDIGSIDADIWTNSILHRNPQMSIEPQIHVTITEEELGMVPLFGGMSRPRRPIAPSVSETSKSIQLMKSIMQAMELGDIDMYVRVINDSRYYPYQISAIKEQEECGICRDKLVVDIKLPCAHSLFHPHCLNEWYKMHKSCPICRRSI